MARLVIGLFFLGVLCSVQARKCDPDEGTDPLPCDPSVCVLPDCACETSEPDISLADRPQVNKLICSYMMIKFKTLVRSDHN